MTAQAVAVGLIGPGLVGKALLEQLEANGHKLGDRAQVCVVGIINSTKMLLTSKVSPERCG